MEEEDKIKFLWDVIKRYDAYIGTTNYKVSLLLAFCTSMLIGIIFKTKDIAGKFDCSILSHIVYILSAIILVASLKSIYHLLKTVFPQTSSHPTEKSLVFFGDVAKTENKGFDYHKSILILTEEQIVKDLSFQVYELSLITSYKFNEIKEAVNTIKLFLLLPSVIFIILISLF